MSVNTNSTFPHKKYIVQKPFNFLMQNKLQKNWQQAHITLSAQKLEINCGK